MEWNKPKGCVHLKTHVTHGDKGTLKIGWPPIVTISFCFALFFVEKAISDNQADNP